LPSPVEIDKKVAMRKLSGGSPIFAILASLAFVPTLHAEEWEIISVTEDELFPSMIYATAMMDEDVYEPDPEILGDPNGLIGIAIDSPGDGSELVIEVAGSEFIRPSKDSIELPETGVTYYVYPTLKYDYANLLNIRQPTPEEVTMTVSVNGESWGEETRRFMVRSINDCPFIALDEEGTPYSIAWMFAAYVNENHPAVDGILGKALKADRVEAFAGYQGDADAVLTEIEAIWETLQEAGFRYSNITQASIESDQVASQHVRLIGDALKTSQANCVEGSVLFASILRKLDMDPFLILVPGHMLVGVYLDEEGDEFVCIETTMLGNATLEEAIESGNATYEKYEEAFDDEDALQAEIIDIAAEREDGVLPIREKTRD